MNAGSKTVLIVEDMADDRELAQMMLSALGHRVLAADTIAIGWQLFKAKKPDLVILDMRLPDGTGQELCKKIRDHQELKATPVIMLTGQAGLEDKTSGFEVGADQYLVKPVAPAELRLWVSALLRRVAYDTGAGDELKAGELAINVKAQLVRYREQVIPGLTGKEFDLLYYLVRKRPNVLSRKHILSNLWHTVAVDRLVDVHLANLRKKLPQELADKIQNVPGRGFRFLD